MGVAGALVEGSRPLEAQPRLPDQKQSVAAIHRRLMASALPVQFD